MKKIYISLLIVGILSISLVAAATGWPILDIFKGKQAKAAPADDILGSSTVIPLQPTDPSSMSCNAQIAQNRQLLLLIADHLGIQGVGHITGEPIRNIARNNRARNARAIRATSRQRAIERAPRAPIRRQRGVFERAPTTPIQIQKGPSIHGEINDEEQITELMRECLEGPPPFILDGDIVVENNVENCLNWVQDVLEYSVSQMCSDACDSACDESFEYEQENYGEETPPWWECVRTCEEMFC